MSTQRSSSSLEVHPAIMFRPSGVARVAGMAYVGLAYLTFLVAYVGLACRTLGLLDQTPFDRGPRFASGGGALAYDLALALVFGLQHSVMARRRFKQWLTRFVPPAWERGTYVWASDLALLALVAFWAHGEGQAPWWRVVHPAVATTLLVLGVIGWAGGAAASFLIDHFELFGLRQVTYWARAIAVPESAFRTPSAYRWVRHPMMVSLLLGLWCTPVLSFDRGVLASSLTAYILVGLFFEERDLIARFGRHYRDYQERVRMLLPWPPGRGRP